MNLTSSKAAWLPTHTLSKLCADGGSAMTSSKSTCQVTRAMQKQRKSSSALTRKDVCGRALGQRLPGIQAQSVPREHTQKKWVKWCTEIIHGQFQCCFRFERATSAKFTFNCALMSRGSRSGAGEYARAFFDRMGSIDLLNSSSSRMMLVSSFSFSKPMLLSRTEPAESW